MRGDWTCCAGARSIANAGRDAAGAIGVTSTRRGELNSGVKNARLQACERIVRAKGLAGFSSEKEDGAAFTLCDALWFFQKAIDKAVTALAKRDVALAQQVIAEESGVTNTVDPLGGSFFVEALTNEMERQCYEYFDRIEEYGGVIPAIKANFFQNEIARASYWYQNEVDLGRKTVVGVNRHVVEEELEIPILEIDPKGEERQRERLHNLRRDRDQQRWQATLDNVRQTAEGTGNIMPALIEAAHADATLGEVTNVLKGVFGVQEFSNVV